MGVGRLLIFAGVLLALVGVAVIGLEKLNLPIGRLPGDVLLRGKRATFYFPVATCIVLSLLGTFLMWLFGRLR